MLRSRRVRRYQDFLRTLKRPDPELCSCPYHLHPRPWVPPPCLTSRPFGKMDRDSLNLRSSRIQPSRYLHYLHHEEDIIKEAHEKIANGEPLPKDMYNTVMKWSKKIPDEDNASKGKQRGKTPSTNSRKEKESAVQDLEREERELRRELRNVRELTQSNVYLLEENKRLMRKVQRLRQRMKRQSEVPGRGSMESVAAQREDEVILSLKKKYDDLLQYVLKVESENQKLNSILGASGERKGSVDGTDHESVWQARRQDVAEMQKEIGILREQLEKKDECLLQYEQHLKTLEDNNTALQDTLKNQGLGGRGPETASLEAEWMRRLNETREVCEQAIQGYKSQLEETQRKLVECEEEHAKEMDELREALAKNYNEELAKSRREFRPEGSHRHKVAERSTQSGSPRDVSDEGVDGSVTHESQKDSEESVKSGIPLQAAEIGDGEQKSVEGGTTLQGTKAGPSSDDHKSDVTAVIKTDERYGEALELIVRRLESLQVGGEEVESMVMVIKDTISTCLQEWKDSFHHAKPQYEDLINLRIENEELQKKIKGKNKKIETLHKQNQDLQQQNSQLLHQSAHMKSRISSQTAEQLEVLSNLPQKVQEAEQQLVDTKELLQKAQIENQTLHNHMKQLEEKLYKKESKLKAEREQGAKREIESLGARESLSSLQNQLEDMSREVNQLQEQLTMKDKILEHTSAQLEDRIRECASLSALVDHYKLQKSQDSDRVQVQLSERESASYKQLLEAQAQASRYQAQLSALHAEKEHNEKSLRSVVRKLEEQVDQLHLRNSTLQRQLTTFTSTYHNMFSNVDLQPVLSPGIGTSTGLKGM